ncbi:MAG: hypothetical protein AAF614_21510 [Chloroflexota bacterium]
MHTADRIVDSLNQLGIYFLANSKNIVSSAPMAPAELIAALASSDEARIRASLIPLFLYQPSYAKYVLPIFEALSPSEQITLRCYYLAAFLLQRKYKQPLQSLLGNQIEIPNLFILESPFSDPQLSHDAQLRHLGAEHARLSGKQLNWYGTYEHAYQRLAKHMQHRQQWLA